MIHHYFGTRRDLYIEVLRHLYFIPPIEPEELPGATLQERAGHLLDRWLAGVARRPNIWLTFTASGGPGADPAVATVLREADELVAQRLIDALELGEHAPAERLLPLVIAWGGLAKGSIHQWLAEKSLTKDDVRTVLVATLMTVLTWPVRPALGPAGACPHVPQEQAERKRPQEARHQALESAIALHQPVELRLVLVRPRQLHRLAKRRG